MLYLESPESSDDRQYYDYHLDRNGQALKQEPMKAKEKAKQLYDSFYNEVEQVKARDGGGWDNCELVESSLKAVAKECALIGVSEIMSDEMYKESNYWNDVKTELEKL